MDYGQPLQFPAFLVPSLHSNRLKDSDALIQFSYRGITHPEMSRLLGLKHAKAIRKSLGCHFWLERKEAIKLSSVDEGLWKLH